MNKKVFVEYKDRDSQGKERVVSGYFELLDADKNRIRIRSGKNIITLPDHQWYKMKESYSETERRNQ